MSFSDWHDEWLLISFSHNPIEVGLLNMSRKEGTRGKSRAWAGLWMSAWVSKVIANDPEWYCYPVCPRYWMSGHFMGLSGKDSGSGWVWTPHLENSLDCTPNPREAGFTVETLARVRQVSGPYHLTCIQGKAQSWSDQHELMCEW